MPVHWLETVFSLIEVLQSRPPPPYVHPRLRAESVPAHAPVTGAAEAAIEMKGIRLAGAPLYLDMQVRAT